MDFITPWARSMLYNDKVLARFRQSMHLPQQQELMHAIDSKVHALICNNECSVEGDEERSGFRVSTSRAWAGEQRG